MAGTFFSDRGNAVQRSTAITIIAGLETKPEQSVYFLCIQPASERSKKTVRLS